MDWSNMTLVAILGAWWQLRQPNFVPQSRDASDTNMARLCTTRRHQRPCGPSLGHFGDKYSHESLCQDRMHHYKINIKNLLVGPDISRETSWHLLRVDEKSSYTQPFKSIRHLEHQFRFERTRHWSPRASCLKHFLSASAWRSQYDSPESSRSHSSDDFGSSTLHGFTVQQIIEIGCMTYPNVCCASLPLVSYFLWFLWFTHSRWIT